MSRQIAADTLLHLQQTIRQNNRTADTTHHTGFPSAADSLAGADSTVVDSLAGVDTLPVARSLFREAEAGELFGLGTTLAPQLRATTQSPVTGKVLLEGFVLLLTVFFIRFLIQNAIEVRFLFTQTFKDAATGKQRIYDEQGNLGYLRFLNTTAVLGILFFGCTLAAYAVPQFALPSPGMPLLIALGGTLLIWAVVLFQLAALGMTGIITLTQPFIRQLLLLKRTYFALLTFAVVPLLLLTVFTPTEHRNTWESLIAAELCIFLFLFLKESLTLFISQKISILHWFLYLCTVECLPISFIWLNMAGK